MTKSSNLTRRGLFRGLGTAALVTGCARPKKPVDGPEPDVPDLAGQIGPEPSAVHFELNGKRVTVEAEPRTTLLQALRLDLDTTGPKQVCDRGACGACTVLVDDVPRNSCMMLAHDVEGRKITTVEGLARGGELGALQRAFVRHDALQCGFCTSGMLISATALLRRSSGRPSRDEVREAIAGNLCRCGTYPHVEAAILDAAKEGA